MKKIYLLILLVVSMSFGRPIPIGYPDEQVISDGSIFAPNFRISTQRSLGVNGFKVYAYFSNDKAGEVPNLVVNELNGAKSITIEPKSSHVYRVVLDFSSTKIPANGYFPSISGSCIALFHAYINKADKLTHALRPYPWGAGFHNIVIESKDGEVLSGNHPNLSSRVGVLSKSSVCKSGGFNYMGSTYPDVLITLNSEKNDNASKLTGPKPNGVSVSGRNVYFGYCAYEYDELPRVSYDYAVFRMDDNCPVGTYPFRRHHDTEDSQGSNYVHGPLWPSSVGSNADLEFCFVPKDPNSTKVYPFGGFVNDMKSNTECTWYYVIQQIGALSKSAAEVAESPISAGQPLVAAAPLAPAIKGLDRSAVAVELKSEGKVKVSIVNVNGSVIANIAQESLQPGIHQIKWNSGMVPSGRYIVKIEQNGMVNAKNVILK